MWPDKSSLYEIIFNILLRSYSGLGKTTLAHTIARHAGYTVREINASDDRSPESFRLALQNGTEMQTTLLDQEKRPNCIILGTNHHPIRNAYVKLIQHFH